MIASILILWILYTLDAPGILVILGWVNFVTCAYNSIFE